MKKSILYIHAAVILYGMTACTGGKRSDNASVEDTQAGIVVPEYKLLNLPTIDLTSFSKDADGWITIFDGTSFDGWRGYNKTVVPALWTIEDNSITFNGTGSGDTLDAEGGDILFAYTFKNFEFEFEWKVAKGSSSGVFFYIQEVEEQPAYFSAPKYQILDNENHPDAKSGKNGNRMSASLYDMISAKPQNAKPYGEWNKGKIRCFKGTVVHYQNNEPVVEYHLWTSRWKEMLVHSKFSKDKCPLAYELLINCGGDNQEGFIGLQGNGGNVWFRNMKVKTLD
ncbi:MAG: DUF1080 domain-containing protein [Tannerellaceae bacterium]|nr:DUF1080 domain-containing protein [Tannerellaceae bacterium]